MSRHALTALSCFLAIALVGSWLLSIRTDARGTTVRANLRYQQPSANAHLGTDHLGRDVANRLATAVGISLRASLFAAGIALVLATVLGVVAGWTAGGLMDRAVDFLSSLLFILPGFLLLLVLGAMFELSLATIYLVAGCLVWPPAARLVRAEVQVLGRARFVTAERAAGFGTAAIFWRTIVPLTLLPPFLSLVYLLPELLGLDLGLSLFGVGAVDPSTPTLGRMVYQGLLDVRQAWWLAVFPTAAMALICLFVYAVAEYASSGFASTRPTRN